MIKLNRFEGYKELIDNSKFKKQNDKILGICESKGIKFLMSTFKYISEEELSDENFKKIRKNLMKLCKIEEVFKPLLLI